MSLRLLACIAVASVASIALVAPRALAATSGANGSHDPSRMIESEGKVYIYSTGGGAKSSPDGLVWTTEPTPPWNRALLANNQGIWAPDGLYLNGQYYLFGSMWSDAKDSAIVLITSPTLNPASPNYKWTDQGVVVAGPVGVTHSCIDPAPVLDTQGNLYVVWGGGYPFATTANSIFLTRLDNKTGLPLTSDPAYQPPNSPGYALEQGHKEGPYIHYHGGFYYLFYQTGSCCSGAASTYLIHVARSQAITGPYTGDQNFYASQGSIHGPGHMGIYSACGFERFTYHYYPDTGGSVIGENELVWAATGWPSVGAQSTTPLRPCGVTGNGGASGGGGRGVNGGGGGGDGGGNGMNGGGGMAGGRGAGATGGAPGTGGIAATGGTVGATGGTGTGGSTVSGTGGMSVSGASGGSPGTGGGSGSVADGGVSGCSCDVRGDRYPNDLRVLGLLGVTLVVTAIRRRRSIRRPPDSPL